MAESINDRLKAAQAKVKTLASSRDQINRSLAVEENNLKTAYTSLRELGVENPEKLTTKQLHALADDLKGQLEEKLTAIEEQLATGEELMKKYQELQES